MKLPVISPPRKNPISNQYSTIIINEQDPILPPLLEKNTSGYKPLFNGTHYPNETEDDFNDYTDNSHTDIDDYLNKLSVKNNEDKDDEYKDDNSQALKSDEIVTKKAEE